MQGKHWEFTHRFLFRNITAVERRSCLWTDLSCTSGKGVLYQNQFLISFRWGGKSRLLQRDFIQQLVVPAAQRPIINAAISWGSSVVTSHQWRTSLLSLSWWHHTFWTIKTLHVDMALYSLLLEEGTWFSCLSKAFNLIDFRCRPPETWTLAKLVASSQGSHLRLTKQDFAVKQLHISGSCCDVLYAKLQLQ